MNNVPDERVDELRRQLRALGYLDAGVDRFLLAPAGVSHGPLALAARSSLRVGLLGGVLLGPAAAIGVGARIPGLVSGARDALVIALYLSILFSLAVSAAAFCIIIVANAIARAGGRDAGRRAALAARAAAWMLTLGCLAYLTFWWRNANAGFGWSAPVWTTIALVLAVAISLLLGRAVRITALAVAAAGRADAALPPFGPRKWRAVLVGGALAFAAAATLLVLTTSAEAPPIQPKMTAASGGRRVRLIAIDGIDPRLYAETAWFPPQQIVGARYRLVPEDTSDPARAWTTIGTGEPPSVHGVRALETRRVAGLQGVLSARGGLIGRLVAPATDLVRLTTPAIASRDERNVLTLWEAAELAGLRTAVVNWWTTWPAATSTGIVITDRALLRLERGGALDAEIAPPSLYPQLQRAWPAIRQRAAEAAAEAFKEIGDHAMAATLRRSAALDATIVGLTDALPGPIHDFDGSYLPGLDIAQHTLLGGRAGAQSPSDVTARVEALRAYYRFLGTLLQPWLRPQDRDVVMIVTQPGRLDTPVAGTVTIAAAPPVDVRPGFRDEGSARVVDIAPTVLTWLGVPVSRELPGRYLVGAAIPAQPRYVPTYGRPNAAPPPREGRPLDQEMIDRLRSLGYVK